MNPLSLISKTVWQFACVVLAVSLVVTSIALWFANSAKNSVRAELKTEQSRTTLLSANIETQNTAIAALKKESEVRQALTATSLDLAQERTESASNALAGMSKTQAKTCDDAMASVNDALKGLK